MINGLAIWHYPHRNPIENVIFFADKGFSSVSMLGQMMYGVCADPKQAEELALAVQQKGVVLTVHHKLPLSHDEEDVRDFKEAVDCMAKWQEKYGLIDILSFDVPLKIRDNAQPYIQYVLQYEQFLKVAVEDFGLTDQEEKQLDVFKNNKRFGYLVDIGHMYIRIRGKNKRDVTLLNNNPKECPVTNNPGYYEFMKAFASKKFQIFEIHLHNNDGVEDLHYFFDDGTLDIKTVAKVLRDIKFDGVLTIESAPGFKFECVYPESDERILQTFDLWKKLSVVENKTVGS